MAGQPTADNHHTKAIELFGNTLVKPNGETVGTESLTAEVIGIYFSAHWCPPCRGFTPSLVEKYEKAITKNKSLQIVFVSSDRSAEQFQSYFNTMPWFAIPFNDPQASKLFSKYGVTSIPTLILLKKDLSVLTKEGRQAVLQDDFIGSLPDDVSIKEATDALVSAVLADETLTIEKRTEGLKTLISIISNLIQNPGDPKYMKLNKDTNTFSNKLSNTNFIKILEIAGFRNTSSCLICDEDTDIKKLKEIRALVNEAYNTLPQIA